MAVKYFDLFAIKLLYNKIWRTLKQFVASKDILTLTDAYPALSATNANVPLLTTVFLYRHYIEIISVLEITDNGQKATQSRIFVF